MVASITHVLDHLLHERVGSLEHACRLLGRMP